MASNMALKRARKAAHRKQMLAQRRRVELLEAGLPARVLRAAETPIQHCLLTKSLFEDGIGSLTLARGAISFHVASFLLDTFCLGIKDVVFKQMNAESFEMCVDAFDAAAGMTSVDPSYARKLLRDLAAWSRTIGFAPHPEFAVVERIFGEVDADASDAAFRFGLDGKPFYIPCPLDTAFINRQRTEQLRRSVGEGGFGFETEP